MLLIGTRIDCMLLRYSEVRMGYRDSAARHRWYILVYVEGGNGVLYEFNTIFIAELLLIFLLCLAWMSSERSCSRTFLVRGFGSVESCWTPGLSLDKIPMLPSLLGGIGRRALISLVSKKITSELEEIFTLAESRGTHSVSVCSKHQNAILFDAVDIQNTYQDLMSMLVCSLDIADGLFHRCENVLKMITLQTISVQYCKQAIEILVD